MEAKISDPLVRKAVYEAYNGKCFWTGQPVAIEDMHIDHIKPVALGGGDELANFALSTERANIKKSAKWDEQAAVPVLYFVKINYLPKMERILKNLKAPRKKKISKKLAFVGPPKPRYFFTLSQEALVLFLLVLKKQSELKKKKIYIEHNEFSVFDSDADFVKTARELEDGATFVLTDVDGWRCRFLCFLGIEVNNGSIAFRFSESFFDDREVALREIAGLLESAIKKIPSDLVSNLYPVS